MRKDNRLWFQRMWISAEILSNVWEEDKRENEMKEEIKETTIEMPITVLCKACKD